MINRASGLFLLIRLLRIGNARNGLTVNMNPATGRIKPYIKLFGWRIHPRG